MAEDLLAATAYDPTTTPATILRVLNTNQDLPTLLADLRDAPDAPET